MIEKLIPLVLMNNKINHKFSSRLYIESFIVTVCCVLNSGDPDLNIFIPLNPTLFLGSDSLKFEIKTFSHGLLIVEDKLSMAHSLETRVPFLDNELSDYASKIPIEMKLKSFGWNVSSCDGHNVSSLLESFSNLSNEKPNIIIADTVKGKGVDFMENKIEWHFSSLTLEQYNDAKRQILDKY